MNYLVLAGGPTIGIVSITARADKLPADCEKLMRPHLPLAAVAIVLGLT